jgi:hypothetical protein
MPIPPRLAASLAFAGCLALYLVDVLYGPWTGDGGYQLAQAATVAAGALPYRDFEPFYTPLPMLLHAVPIAAGVPPWWLVPGLPIAWVLVVGALTVGLLRQDLPRLAGWPLGLAAGGYALFCLEYAGNHLTGEHGVVAFGLAAALAFRRGQADSVRRFWWAGMLSAGAFWCKQSGALMVLPFLTQVRTGREALALTGGWLAPAVAIAGGLGVDPGHLARSLGLVGAYARQFEADAPTPLATVAAALAARAWHLVRWELHRSPPGTLLLLGTAAAAAWAMVRTPAWRARAWLAAWALLAAAHLASRLLVDAHHYVLNAWPSLVVIAGAACRLASPRLLRVTGLAWLAASLALVGAYRHQQPLWLHRWAGGSLLAGELRTVATELAAALPAERWVYSAENNRVIPFLAGKVPLNPSWLHWSQDFDRLAEIPSRAPDGRPVPVLLDAHAYSTRALRADLLLSPRWTLVRTWQPGPQRVELWVPRQ